MPFFESKKCCITTKLHQRNSHVAMAPVTPVALRNLKMASVPLGQVTWRELWQAPSSNLQRNAASQKWSKIVREVFSWSLWFMCYGCQRRRRRRGRRRNMGKSQGRSLHVGAPLLGSKVSYMLCSVPVSSWEALCASFQSYLGVARYYSIQTTTAYKQPPPSLHRLICSTYTAVIARTAYQSSQEHGQEFRMVARRSLSRLFLLI